MEKREARAAANQLRKKIAPEQLRQFGQEMAASLFASPPWALAETVFCYVSMPNEADTFPILRRALAEGKRLLVPRVIPNRPGAMELVVLTDLAQLQPQGNYGILEPTSGEIFSPERFSVTDLALIPCLAVDKKGVRLGHGGGYYDRFLAQYCGKKLLLCPSALLFDTLPADPWDAVFAPWEILTEAGFLAQPFPNGGDFCILQNNREEMPTELRNKPASMPDGGAAIDPLMGVPAE